MPIQLLNNDISIEVEDAARGGRVIYNLRLPSTEERVEYISKLFKKSEDGAEMDVEHKASCALKLVKGFEKGSFEVDGEIISSDKEDEDYFPEWQKYIKEKFVDHLLVLSTHVYERLSVKKKGVGFSRN